MAVPVYDVQWTHDGTTVVVSFRGANALTYYRLTTSGATLVQGRTRGSQSMTAQVAVGATVEFEYFDNGWKFVSRFVNPGDAAGADVLGALAGGTRRQGKMFVDTMRDARYVSMGANGIFGTTARGLADAPQPRLSALVQQQIVEMSLDGLVSVVKVKHKSVGVLLTGAGERQPDRTLYRIAGEFATPGGCVLQAFLAMAPAAPTAAAAGQVVALPIWLQQSVGGLLSLNELVSLAPPGVVASVNYTNRALVVGIAVVNYTGATVNAEVVGQFSVQRLIGPSPRTIDRRLV